MPTLSARSIRALAAMLCAVACTLHAAAHADAPAPLDQARSEASLARTTVEAHVLAPDGSPVPGAIVVTTAGGQGVTDSHGVARFTVTIDGAPQSLRVTAIAAQGATTRSASVPVMVVNNRIDAGVITLRDDDPCQPAWLPTFGPAPGVSNLVNAVAVFDDGTGPAIYVGGSFNAAGGVAASRIARWNGQSWSPLTSGTNSTVRSLAVFDDGAGPALFVGGTFTEAGGVPANSIAKWDGAQWSALADGLTEQSAPSPNVYAMAVFDDGDGPALFVGGVFTNAGGHPASNIAKWDGAAWSALGAGANNPVWALLVHDDGAGEALYAAGQFTSIDAVAAERIAKFDGAAWSQLAGGLGGFGSAIVRALASIDFGDGPRLVAAGIFSEADAQPAPRIAIWGGGAWSPAAAAFSGSVFALAVYDNGAGPAIYAGGQFTSIDGEPMANAARWDGQSWSALGDGVSGIAPIVVSMAVVESGPLAGVYSGGVFNTAGGFAADNIAFWSDQQWSPMGHGLSNNVLAITVYDDGAGPKLYAAGNFRWVNGVEVNRVARWDGAEWTPLADGFDGVVHALYAWDDGAGPALYAGGAFTNSGATELNGVARWSGQAWSPLADGVDGFVWTMTSHDDGAGEALYIGGGFTLAGQTPANNIARWDGAAWSALGAGVDAPFSPTIYALTVYDDGAGPDLYAAGSFTTAGGVTANRVARWDGGSWSPLATGANSIVRSLFVHDFGAGAVLLAGGQFSTMDGQPAPRVAVWDGASWSAMGAQALGVSVYAFMTFNDGDGDALYAAGQIATVDGQPFNHIARWTGSQWAPVENGVNGFVNTLAAFDIGDGPSLFLGGNFRDSPAGDSYIARRAGCIPPCPADLNQNRVVDGADLGILLLNWGQCAGACAADLNNDGVVDGADLGILLLAWGACP